MTIDLILQLEAFDNAFALNIVKILKVHQPFASVETQNKLENNLFADDLHKINALVGAFSFLSWPLTQQYYNSKDADTVLLRYCTMYGSKSELLSLVLNRFRESMSMGEYLHSTLLKKLVLELEVGFSLIAFQVLILDQIQQYHHFLSSLNHEKEKAQKLQEEILQRNKELNQFYQNSEHQLKSLVTITMGKLPKITTH